MTINKNEAGNLLPKVFTFNPSNQPIRVEMINNEPYFVAKDVCRALSISNDRDAISRLDEDEKTMSVLPTQFGDKEMNLVNESGLYNLIFQSRKPEARAFRKWVTGEVLPNIRRSGRFELTAPKEKPSNEFYVNLCRSITIAGSQRSLSEHLRVSESVISDLFARPHKSSRAMVHYIGEACRTINEHNAIPATFPVKRPPMRRSMANKMGFLVDICKIDNSELRLSLVNKLIGGNVL